MRKILLSILLATTVAAPALSRPPESKDDGRSPRAEERSDAPKPRVRSESRSERPRANREFTGQRSERANVERVRRGGDSVRERSSELQRGGEGFEGRPAAVERRRVQLQRRSNVNERGRPTLAPREQSADSVANWRERQRERLGSNDQWKGRNGDGEGLVGRRQAPPAGARPDRPAPAPATARHRDRHSEWRTSWRDDHRYDWRNHRRHNRSLFHLGFYFDPFGWSYRRYNIGWRLWPSYYSSNYWLNDPYQYRLPYAPWPYRWIRYYDDALLVDTMSGQVVDVMYDFFW